MYRYLLLSVFLFAGCAAITPYKRDAQQGQIIAAEQLTQLTVGMPLNEVNALLGQPTLVQSNNNRIDYAIEVDGESKLLSIHHDGETVTKID